MVFKDRDQDVICALSTASGNSAIAVIRASGEFCLSIVKNNLSFLPEKPESHKAYFGSFKRANNQIIDEVVATYYAQGRSYTGEESIEISCHGNQTIISAILRELIESGCRTADRGEFTYRAFINGRIDLIQAEGVYTLIQSQSEKAAQQALRQLKGHLSQELRSFESDLLWCLAHIEASIDFSQENLETASSKELLHRLNNVLFKLEKLVKSYRAGKIINEGIRVVFAGSPNVGKSSIFNFLIEQDRSIVTEVPGTTRDTVDASLQIGGVKATLIDTAGIRETTDKIEKLGVERSYDKINDSDLILFVYDVNSQLKEEEMVLLRSLLSKNLIIIANKSDLNLSLTREFAVSELANQLSGSLSVVDERLLLISTFCRENRDILLNKILQFIQSLSLENQDVIIQARHYENLFEVVQRLKNAIQSLEGGVGAEFIALDLKEALMFIHQTLGEKFDDQIIDRIFNEFCIGK